MKPFDLQEYLKNPERKLVTRNNKRARIICTDRLDSCPVVGLIRIGDCDEVCTYTKDGERYTQREDKYDLFSAPEKKTGWINLYDLRGKIICGCVYASEKAARGQIDPNISHITTIPIKWEE